MASTITLNSTMTWAQRFNFNRTLAVGNGNEPAITSGNTVLQAILGPPFAWRWNRVVVTPTLASGTQDVVQAVNFGWIETASVQDISVTPSKWVQISPELSLALESSQARPRFISPQADDNAGNITFRVQPAPDKNYPLNITCQQKAPLFTSLNQTWAPIPDEFSYIYNWGFLALMWLFANDSRWQIANGKFVSHLLGAAQGLKQEQINIFLLNWQQITGQPIANSLTLQQGIQARGA